MTLISKSNEKLKYLKDIKILIPVHGKKEKEYLNQFKINLDEYEDEFPNATYSDYTEQFGEVKEVVIAYIENSNEDYLIKKLKMLTIVAKTSIVIIVLSLLVCIWFAFLLQKSYMEAKRDRITEIETTITEE